MLQELNTNSKLKTWSRFVSSTSLQHYIGLICYHNFYFAILMSMKEGGRGLIVNGLFYVILFANLL